MQYRAWNLQLLSRRHCLWFWLDSNHSTRVQPIGPNINAMMSHWLPKRCTLVVAKTRIHSDMTIELRSASRMNLGEAPNCINCVIQWESSFDCRLPAFWSSKVDCPLTALRKLTIKLLNERETWIRLILHHWPRHKLAILVIPTHMTWALRVRHIMSVAPGLYMGPRDMPYTLLNGHFASIITKLTA